MRFSLKLSALLALLLLAFSLVGGTGAGAQDEPEEFDLSSFEGIQHGVSRTYTVDYEAMMASMSTPGAEMEMPSGLLSVSALVLEFDDDGNAESAFDTVKEEAGSQLSSEDGEEIDLDLGDNSVSFKTTEESDGMAMDVVVTVAQQDNYIYLVYAGGSEVDVEQTVKDLTQSMIDADGSGEGEFSEDGTSTGGLWDKFPAADDELVSGLVASDMVVYPEPESSPEA